MDSLIADFRSAIRSLLSRPGFSVLAALTLAIGIGVNAVAFSAINGLLFKTHRFVEPSTLGWIPMQGTGNPYNQVTWPEYREIAAAARGFEGIVAEGRRPLGLRDGNSVRQVWSLCVSSNYLTTLRARAVVGRVFTPADLATGDLPVVVSYRFWRDHLGGDSIAGRTIVLNARSASIVGVLADDFQGPGGLFEPDVWVPLERIEALGLAELLTAASGPWLGMAGRLAPGITAAQASGELQAIGSGLPQAPSRPDRARRLTFWPVLGQHPDVRQLAPVAYVALAIVGLVLLLACFNVAALLLARAADRQREISVRAALGASRARIIRQFALEGLLLAIVSGAAALVLAQWSAELLATFSLPSPIPQRLHVDVDRRVIAVTVAMIAIAGILPALLPAFAATRADLLRSMKMTSPLGHRRSRTRGAFVVAQIAGSTLLLTLACLLLQSFWNDSTAGPGFETEHLVVLELQPSNYGYTPSRTRAFFDALLERVRALPGIEHAAVADRIPFHVGFPSLTQISTRDLDCSTAECRGSHRQAIGPDHFRALGVRIVAGREFSERDVQEGTGAVVNETMAARLWPGRSAVGEWIREGRHGGLVQVIGVAADAKYAMLNEQPADRYYRPLGEQDYAAGLTLVARTAGPAATFIPQLHDQIQALDENLPPSAIKTMDDRMALPLWPVRAATGLFSICGALALVLATVGLFGTTYLTVGQRTREFGIRSALGATRARVVGLVVGEGLWLALPGIVLGLGGAFLAGRAAGSVIVQVDPADVTPFAATAVLQTLVALLACLLPAHRATKADPILALRAE
jgi:predicted permease